jgi:hypothetical protein
MGFPQDIRGLEDLNKLLDEIGTDELLDEIGTDELLDESGEEHQRQREQELRQPQPVRTITPRVEATLGNLLFQMKAELWAQ